MDGDEFLRNHPLTPVACLEPATAPAPTPATAAAPAPAPAPAPTASASDEVRDEVRERVFQAIGAELVHDREIIISEAERALRTLNERIFKTTRYDDVIRLPLRDAVSAILSDLGFKPRRTGEAFPPPDPPPRMIHGP